MGEEEAAPQPISPSTQSQLQLQLQPIPEQDLSLHPDPSPPVPNFDPGRMIGIIKRKTLIKELTAAYHAECLDYCQLLLNLQRKWEETYHEIKASKGLRRDTSRPTKRVKKGC